MSEPHADQPAGRSAPLATGARVLLRRLSPADLAPFQAYRADPEVARFQDWTAMDETEATRFLTAMANEPLFRPGHWSQVAIAADGRLVGDMGIHVSEHADTVELGITLARAAQGRGLATEALALAIALLRDRCPGARMVMWTDRRNQPAQRLIRRAGLAWEAEETTRQPDGTDLVEDRFVLP